MSWIQENKFVAALAGVTIVVAGGISYFAISQNGTYEGKLEEYDELRAGYERVTGLKPYPNEENLELRKLGIEKYKSAIGEVQQKISSYAVKATAAPSPQEFSDARVLMEKNLQSAFTKVETKLPSGCSFGFEKYATVQPKPETTGELAFQLGSVESLLSMLAEAKPHELINVRRKVLPIEDGVSQDKSSDGEGKLYNLMPVELSFTASEASLKSFLKKAVNSKDYFYTINAIRITNEKQKSPSLNDAEFEVSISADDSDGGMGDFDFGDDMGEPEVEPEEDEFATPGDRVLKQLLGQELLHVHVSFNLLLPTVEG